MYTILVIVEVSTNRTLIQQKINVSFLGICPEDSTLMYHRDNVVFAALFIIYKP